MWEAPFFPLRARDAVRQATLLEGPVHEGDPGKL